MILHHANIAIIVIVFVFVVSSIEANHNHDHCEQKCGVGKTPKTVPFPFGFSDGCGIRLNCSDPNTEYVTIGEFQVQNITADNIFVGFPAKCARNMSALHTLFGNKYAMTRNNGLLLQNCSSHLDDCVMSRGLIEQRFDLKSCNQSDSMNCYSLRNNRTGLLRFDDLNHDLNRNQCKFLFSSFAFNSRGDSGVSLEFHRLELDWWLPGNCNCSKHADCATVELAKNSSGFRCLCKKGFQGDGFAAGNGCRKTSDCDASNFIAGRCGNRIFALVGGLVVGASLMAGLALFCYCIRRRTPSFRNTLSAKRLLCEAAGNSSVPFYPYKEIEKATSGFDEKQRLGTGAYEELEHIRVSAWASNMYMASPSASCCSSSDCGSERSLSGLSTKKSTVMSQRLIVPSRAADCLTKLEEVKDSSPVSVQDPWLSEQSSPSTNSLLGNVVR
ncbi:hypothetical protein Q3G72_016453 [Acer saccharum]|nr:hypothetical protein Q3G72_016453 [Acer saccharum]